MERALHILSVLPLEQKHKELLEAAAPEGEFRFRVPEGETVDPRLPFQDLIDRPVLTWNGPMYCWEIFLPRRFPPPIFYGCKPAALGWSLI